MLVVPGGTTTVVPDCGGGGLLLLNVQPATPAARARQIKARRIGGFLEKFGFVLPRTMNGTVLRLRWRQTS